MALSAVPTGTSHTTKPRHNLTATPHYSDYGLQEEDVNRTGLHTRLLEWTTTLSWEKSARNCSVPPDGRWKTTIRFLGGGSSPIIGVCRTRPTIRTSRCGIPLIFPTMAEVEESDGGDND